MRVGYFINNEYSDPELRENPPVKPQFDKVMRNILASKPRVTRFKINWDNAEEEQNGEGSGLGGESIQVENGGMQWNEDMGMMKDPSQDSNAMLGAGNENSNSLAMECWGWAHLNAQKSTRLSQDSNFCNSKRLN